MSLVQSLRLLWQRQTGDDETPFDGDTGAFLISLGLHLIVIVSLSLLYTPIERRTVTLTMAVPTEEKEDIVTLPEEFQFSEAPSEDIGANSLADSGMALSLAPNIGEISEVPSPVELSPTENANIDINLAVTVPTGLHFDNLPVKGVAGEGETGASGAVDRLTQEILVSLEDRKTLVVWIFDQSPSVIPQRQMLQERIDRIYTELGIIEAAGNPAFKRQDDKPLLTAVVTFGDQVKLLTEKPTDNIAEIKGAIGQMEFDESGIERVFSAVYMAADKFKSYRLQEPRRNVMIVVFTDEVGDDQKVGLEQTVKLCRRYQMPVYVVGVPAPFGREETLVRWVDPDPSFDQTPQNGTVNQGPESFLPERLKLSFLADGDAPMDSGFGPFGLTRLCYETGGIYFSVHPNRNVNRPVSRAETATYAAHLKHFFDPVVMRKYRPDYVSADEYMRRVMQNKARAALIQAAQLSGVERLEPARLEFVKRGEAELAQELSEAQKGAAKLEPIMNRVYEVLKLGEADREKETSPRWQAGFDLAMGQVMAVKIRAESYNAMLALAKRGLKFQDEKNNTWVLTPAAETEGVGSQLQKASERARMYLERVVQNHPGTPWATLAQKELDEPLGWKWEEKYTELNPPREGMPGNDNNNNTPRDDKARKLKRPELPKRELKRL